MANSYGHKERLPPAVTLLTMLLVALTQL